MFNKKNEEISRLKEEIDRLEKLNNSLQSKLSKQENKTETYRLNYIRQKMMNRAWEIAVQKLAIDKLGYEPGKEANNTIWFPACDLQQEVFERYKETTKEEEWDLK